MTTQQHNHQLEKERRADHEELFVGSEWLGDGRDPLSDFIAERLIPITERLDRRHVRRGVALFTPPLHEVALQLRLEAHRHLAESTRHDGAPAHAQRPRRVRGAELAVEDDALIGAHAPNLGQRRSSSLFDRQKTTVRIGRSMLEKGDRNEPTHGCLQD